MDNNNPTMPTDQPTVDPTVPASDVPVTDVPATEETPVEAPQETPAVGEEQSVPEATPTESNQGGSAV